MKRILILQLLNALWLNAIGSNHSNNIDRNLNSKTVALCAFEKHNLINESFDLDAVDWRIANLSDGIETDQTENLKQIIDIIQEYNNQGGSTDGNADFESRLLAAYNSLQPIIDEVLLQGTQAQKKLAAYCKLMTCYILAVLMGETSNQAALDYLTPIRTIAEGFTYYDFPLVFSYQGLEYEWAYSHYVETYEHYLSFLSELEVLTDHPNAVVDLKKHIAVATIYTEKCYSIAYLINLKIQEFDVTIDLLDYSNQYLESYIKLDQSKKNLMDSLDIYTGYKPHKMEVVYNTFADEDAPAPNSFYTRAYPIYKQLGDIENMDKFMQTLYYRDYEEYDFLWELSASESTKADSNRGNRIAEKIDVKTLSTDCYNLQRLAELYFSVGNESAAKSTQKRADNCHNQEKKLTEKTQRKNEKREKKFSNSYDVNPGLYLGADIFPMLSTVKGHRDFGFCVDFVGRSKAHEFYYEIINMNRDWMYDLATKEKDTDGFDLRWSGYNAHYAFKSFTESDNAAPYIGFMARYRSKTFEPIASSVTDASGILLSSDQLFAPTEQQFELFLNYGFMTTKPGFALDMYFGFGPKYSIFSHNIANYKNDDIYSHPLLEYRAEERWGLGLRVGITVGLKVF